MVLELLLARTLPKQQEAERFRKGKRYWI